MRTNEQSSNTSEYWMGVLRAALARQVKIYMDTKGLNPSQLAKALGTNKTFVTQVLNGKFNQSLQKLIDLSIALDIAPLFEFKPVQEFFVQQEKKSAEMQIRLTGNCFLYIKGSKIKVPLLQNENGMAVSLDVHLVSTITPSETKIA